MQSVKDLNVSAHVIGVARTRHIKGKLLYQATILYNYVPFQNNLLKERICSHRERIHFSEQFLKIWKISFGTWLGELPWVLLFLLRMCVYCVMGATPVRVSSLSLSLLINYRSVNTKCSEEIVWLCKLWVSLLNPFPASQDIFRLLLSSVYVLR